MVIVHDHYVINLDCDAAWFLRINFVLRSLQNWFNAAVNFVEIFYHWANALVTIIFVI